MKIKIYGSLLVCMLVIFASFIPVSASLDIIEINKKNTNINVDWWPMFHHDISNMGYSTSTGPDINPVLWSYSTNSRVISSPAVVDGKVFIGSNDKIIYCLDSINGDLIWTYTTGSGVHSSPAVADGKVFIGSNDGNIYCLDIDDGNLIWNYPTGGIVVSSPTIENNKVFFGSNDNNLYCLNANNGSLLWNFQTSYHVSCTPAIFNNSIYFGSRSISSNNFYCLDANNGSLIWDFSTGGIHSSPAIANEKVYVGSYDNKIYCLDAGNGSLIWNYTTGGDIFSSPAVAYGNVYVGSYDNNIYCLDVDNGSLIWTYPTSDVVYSSPAVADGKVYIGSNDGNIYCLNASDGGKIWSSETTMWIWSSPAIADGKVYIGAYDGKIYAFGNNPPNKPMKPSGTTKGEAGDIYHYFSSSVDPDEHQIYLWFDWGDGTNSDWIGPYNSGEIKMASHSWSQNGTYQIRVKAKDIYDAESNWSDPLSVSMPKTKSFNINSLFIRFLENHPNIFPILREILGRKQA